MPSSTSSSDSPDAASSPRRVALRTGAAALGLVASGLLFVRCTTYGLDWALAEDVRLREAVAALPELAARPGPTGLVFGSSLVFSGFSPSVFDARLREHGAALDTFSFGIGGLNPRLQRVLARRVRRAFEAQGGRLAFTLVEFNPFQTTKARLRAQAASHEQILMLLATPDDVLRLALESPTRAARTFAVRYLRAGVTAEAITEVLGVIATLPLSAALPSAPSPDPPDVPPGDLEKMRARSQARLELIGGLFEAFGGRPVFWELEHRGEVRLLFPETREALERLESPTPYELGEDLARRQRCCDIIDLDFDDTLVEDFVAMVRELAAISDRIEIVLWPKNHAWVQNPPEALERQRAVLERIARETGVAIADFQERPALDGSMFADSTHLSIHRGMPAFSTFLADHYGPRLASVR